MATIKSKTLFFTTSPRTPLKMLPELEILTHFQGQKWNQETQIHFLETLAKSDTFQGIGSLKDKAFSARDRINRAPKSLGFVDLSPAISLTKIGHNFIHQNNKEEILLRQLLKFQLPSPYHKEAEHIKGTFNVKPYLEIFRLIYHLESISFDELVIFGMQLIHYNQFNNILTKIQNFRKQRKQTTLTYREFKNKIFYQEISKIYRLEIANNTIKTRESRKISRENFIQTKANNLRDYTDACFRYLRTTGMVEIAQRNFSLSIPKDKREEVKFLLRYTPRKPSFINDESKYKAYLFDENQPRLFCDDKTRLLKKLSHLKANTKDLIKLPIAVLKEKLKEATLNSQQTAIKQQIKNLKNYKDYNDVIQVFKEIQENKLYDAPLLLEWNLWRAFNLLNGGEIQAHLKFDDSGIPLSAARNLPDIVCNYGEFGVIIEATMQRGHRQYEMEGESVARHLANLKKSFHKEAYCFFIAPKINEACIAHFYALHKISIQYYGGESVIVPLELNLLIQILKHSYKTRKYSPQQIQKIFLYSKEQAKVARDEKQWYNNLQNKILSGIF